MTPVWWIRFDIRMSGPALVRDRKKEAVTGLLRALSPE